MASIFWVEDQSHWIKKFSPVLEVEEFDGQPTELAIYHFAEAARQKIALTDKGSPPDVALLDARMNGNDQAGFTVSNALRKKWPGLPIIYLSEHAGTDIERAALEQCVRIAFGQRRKTLRNTLGKSYPADALAACGIDVAARPADIAVDNYLQLARALAKQ